MRSQRAAAKIMPPTPPLDPGARGELSSESQVWESTPLCDGVPHAMSTWS